MAHSRHSRIDNCDYTVGDEGEIIVKSRDTNEEGVLTNMAPIFAVS